MATSADKINQPELICQANSRRLAESGAELIEIQLLEIAVSAE